MISKLKMRLENWLFITLLRRHGDLYLDQFDLFKIKSKYGWVYVDISREPLSGEDHNYHEVK